MTTLANDERAQAIRVPSLGLTAVNFWQPGTVAGLTTGAPASVLLREHADGQVRVCVSDPTRTAKELTLVWRGPAARPVGACGSATVTATGDGVRITVDTSAMDGATHTVTWARPA